MATKEGRVAANAEAAAAKASAKALRPLWKKKRVIIPVALMAVAILVSVSNGGKKSASTAVSGSDTIAGVTGEVKEIKDVTVTSCKAEFGLATVGLKATNSSSKRSDYSVTVNLFAADGTQIGTADGFLEKVDPAKSALHDAVGTVADGSTLDHCSIVKVNRTASI
jgi:hypothetical protein